MDADIAKLFLEKLGTARLSVILSDLDLKAGRTLTEKAEALLHHIGQDEDELYRLIADGFDSLYHQTMYLRRTDDELLIQADTSDEMNFELIPLGAKKWLCLVPYELQFHVLAEQGGGTTTVWDAPMTVPARLETGSGRLVLRVLTVRNVAWDKIFNRPISRKITNIQTDQVRDQIFSSLQSHGFDIGSVLDFSQKAHDVIASEEVDTFSGTSVEIRLTDPVGSSTHRTTGTTSGRRPLRTARFEQFKEVLDAGQLSMLDISFNKELHGLLAGTGMVLYPDTGRIRVSSKFEQGDLNEFLEFLSQV